MQKQTTSFISHVPQGETPEAALGIRTQSPVGPSASQAGESLGLITSGESSPLPGGFPESGESYTFIAKAGRAEVQAHPLPHPEVPGYAALTDYLNCTFPFPEQQKGEGVLMGKLLNVLGPKFAPAKNRGRGLNGYARSFDLGPFGAKFAYGGQYGTAFLLLPGQACAAISDWAPVRNLLEHELQARITRWDGAVDDLEGRHPLEEVVSLYQAGAFTNGGNRPSCRQAGNWIDPDGSGRTFYVGKRQNGKMLRAYEKGQQCGRDKDPWVRYELELHNVYRVIPWDVLDNPGSYVAGAYPNALGWIREEASRLRTTQKEGALSYEHLVASASHAYGRLINVMLEVEGSPEAVVNKLRKPGTPSRLQFPTSWK